MHGDAGRRSRLGAAVWSSVAGVGAAVVGVGVGGGVGVGAVAGVSGRTVAVVLSAVVAVGLAVGACQAPTAGDDVLACVEDGLSWQACGAVPPGMQPRAPMADYGTGYP
jgi:hypothetical protein